jgi:hypothetical protein
MLTEDERSLAVRSFAVAVMNSIWHVQVCGFDKAFIIGGVRYFHV